MADLNIRELPDWVIEAHLRQAERVGVSLEDHLKMVITDSARDPKTEFLERARRVRENIKREHGGPFPGRAADLIREMRDERG